MGDSKLVIQPCFFLACRKMCSYFSEVVNVVMVVMNAGQLGMAHYKNVCKLKRASLISR